MGVGLGKFPLGSKSMISAENWGEIGEKDRFSTISPLGLGNIPKGVSTCEKMLS